jgi:CRP-like cAMP-binding protein
MRQALDRMSRIAIYRAEERAVIGRLLIDLLKIMHGARRQFGDQQKDHLNGDLDFILLCYAILIGVTAGRPKNATEISRFVDIPRATAQRKLDDLEKQGVVARKGSKYHLIGPQLTEASAGLDEYIDKCLLLIKRAAQSV